MLDYEIYIQLSEILQKMKKGFYTEGLDLCNIRLQEELPLDIESHIKLLKAICHLKLEEYPLVVNTINQILKNKYKLEHHVVSQALQIRAAVQIARSKYKYGFIDLSSALNLLCYHDRIMDQIDILIEKIQGKNV